MERDSVDLKIALVSLYLDRPDQFGKQTDETIKAELVAKAKAFFRH